MKKILATLLSSLVLALLVPATSFADSGRTTIWGLVTENGMPVKHAKVVVICNRTTKKTKTNRAGYYSIVFKAKECSNKSTANVTVTYKGESGSNTGKVRHHRKRINVVIVNVSVVPEFGLITAAGSAIVGAVAILAIRRCEISGNKV